MFVFVVVATADRYLWIVIVLWCAHEEFLRSSLVVVLQYLCVDSSWHVSPRCVLLQRIYGVLAVDVAVWVPIVADVFVLNVEVSIGGDAVVGRVLLLVVGVFHLLVLIWLRGALMPVLGQLLVVSSTEVLVVVLLCGM